MIKSDIIGTIKLYANERNIKGFEYVEATTEHHRKSGKYYEWGYRVTLIDECNPEEFQQHFFQSGREAKQFFQMARDSYFHTMDGTEQFHFQMDIAYYKVGLKMHDMEYVTHEIFTNKNLKSVQEEDRELIELALENTEMGRVFAVDIKELMEGRPCL